MDERYLRSDLIMPLNPPRNILEVLQPRMNEMVLRLWRCSGFIWSDDDDESNGGWSKGYLVATDQRLSFLQDARTLRMKKTSILYQSIEMASIVNVSSAKRGSRDLVVNWIGKNRPVETVYRSLAEVDPNTFQETGPTDTSRAANDIIGFKMEVGRRAFVAPVQPNLPAIQNSPPATVQSPIPVVASVIDYPYLASVLARNGHSPNDLKCIHCGNVLYMPSSGDSVFCGYCGTRIMAKDMFEALRPSLRNP